MKLANFSLIVKNYHRLILLILSRTTMVTLFSIQLCSITRTYMDGDTISKVDLSFPEYLTLPSVSLCLKFMETLNTTLISSISPSIAHIFESPMAFVEDSVARHQNIIEMYEFLGNHSLKELKNIMKTPMKNFIGEITPTQLEPDDGSSVTCNTIRYLYEPLFCYTITCLNAKTGEPAEYPRSTIFEPRYGGRMLTISLDWLTTSKITESMILTFTTPGSVVGGSFHSSYSLNLSKKPATFIVTYSMIRNNLASVSTETNCTPEGPPDEGKGDKVIRFNYCTNQRLRSTLGVSFFGTTQYIDDPEVENLKPGYYQYYREFLNSNLAQRDIERQIFQEVRSTCSNKIVSPNCVTEIYTPVGDGFTEKDKSDFTIIVNAPTVPFENNEFFLEIALLDYLIYISSSLSFWFGISIISIVNRITSTIIKYIDSKKETIKSINDLDQKSIRKRKKSQKLSNRVLSKFNSLNQFGDNLYLTYRD